MHAYLLTFANLHYEIQKEFLKCQQNCTLCSIKWYLVCHSVDITTVRSCEF